MAFMLGSCQQKLQAEPAKSNNLFSTLLGKSEAEVQARTSSPPATSVSMMPMARNVSITRWATRWASS